VQGSLCTRAANGDIYLKSAYFTDIGSSNVKTIADRQRHATYINKHWWRAF